MCSLEQLACSLREGSFDQAFTRLYGCVHTPAAECRVRYGRLIQGFARQFGEGEREYFFCSAPGRTELGGNHTDHQQGCVLAASVNLDVIALVAENHTRTVRVVSEGFDPFCVDLASLEPSEAEAGTSRALVRGVCAAFEQRGWPVSGFDLYTTSNVLKGSGLSSSAAFEVLIGTVVNHLFARDAVSPVTVARIGQYAENVFFGKPSGLLDQMACAVGGVVAIDFRDREHPLVEEIQLDLAAAGYALCIVDTGADHANLTDEYAAIPREMCSVAQALGKPVLREVEYMEFLKNLPRLRAQVGDRALLRAAHFFAENARAPRQAQALKEKDMDRYFSLVRESGLSSFRYLQNVSCRAASADDQPVALCLALAEALLEGTGACRVHGGGFAGTIQAYVPLSRLEHFRTGMEALLGAGMCHVVAVRPVGGVCL